MVTEQENLMDHHWEQSIRGNPLSSPRTREEMVTSSLNVTMDTLNRLSGRRNLLRLFSTGEINITPMIKARNDAFTITLQFTVKETTCKKKAIDLSRCAFKAGKETEAPCYAETLILETNTWNSNVQCNLTSSGPDSTEMLFMVRKRTDTEKTDRDFENRWREWTKIFMEELKERKQQRENRRREEEENKIKME